MQNRGLIGGLLNPFQGGGGGLPTTSTPPPSTPTPAPNFFSSLFGILGGGSTTSTSIHTPTPSTTPSTSASSSMSTPSLSSSTSSLSSSASSSTSHSSSSSLSSSSPSPVSSLTTSTSTTNGQPITITSYVNAAPSATNSISGSAVRSNGFLQNKPLSGTIFALLGVFIVVIFVLIITAIARKRQRKRLLRDAAALSFDPNDVEERGSAEKFRFSGTYSNQSHSHLMEQAYNPATVPNPAYFRPDYGGAYGTANTSNPTYNNLMPNPYTTYGNPVYQPPRSPSPVYTGVAPGNDNMVAHPGARSPSPPGGAQEMTRGPSPLLPPTDTDMHEDDVYGGITSVDRIEARMGNSSIPRALQVRNK